MVDVDTHAGLLTITFGVGLARDELPKASAAHTEEDDREKSTRKEAIDGDMRRDVK
jgi:hypothetical protein